jgi:hypothetical protein
MKPEKQRIAIAEACGTKLVEALDGFWDVERNGFMHAVGCCKKDLVQGLPDYLNDLNAMHAAEKVLTYEQAEEFVEQLYLADQKNNLAEKPRPWRFNVASATAIERAEAFLKTIGKWEEEA